jgi:hypothetical protein
MDTAARARSSGQLLIVGALATVWNGFCAFDFLMTMSVDPVYLAGFSDAQRAFWESFPKVIKLVWAAGVLGGLAGSLLLLFRSRFAGTALLVSLVSLMATALYQYGLANPPEEMTTRAAMTMTAAILAAAFGLLVYAQVMNRRGVLR